MSARPAKESFIPPERDWTLRESTPRGCVGPDATEDFKSANADLKSST
jgi:hypothetical protein